MQSFPSPGTGYFVQPESGTGPGVLFIPSSWGLTPAMKDKAHALADAGFSVLVPDLNDGEVATDVAHAHELLMNADMNVTASLVQSSLRLLQAATGEATKPVGVLGYAAGASWALWLSVRFADNCSAVSTFYGTQTISFDDSQASYLLHFADDDPHVTDDDVALMGLNLQLAKRDFLIEQHAGVASGFAEAHHPSFDEATEQLAWQQTLDFLTAALISE